MITEGFLARHHMGRAGMAAPALLDGDEAQIAACSPRDRRLVNRTIAQLATLHEAAN